MLLNAHKSNEPSRVCQGLRALLAADMAAICIAEAGRSEMEIVIAGVVGLWFFTLYRGRLFVRAYMYLMMLEEFGDLEKANECAMMLGYKDAARIAPSAKGFARQFFGGKQLPVMAEARRRGFRG